VDHETLLNTGVIVASPSAPRAGTDTTRRTFIVTGIARSGTSLVAAWLKEAGMFIGEFLHNVVNEDAQILELLRNRDTELLQALIRARNAAHAQWGFKIPNLHAYLTVAELSLFRNPHLIVIYRDPVAVGVRNALSEYYDALDSMVKTANAMYGLAQFAQRADCPVLLLSYEKALSMPDTVIDQLLEFCGMQLDDATRSRLLSNVQPNRAEYLVTATASYEGKIDCMRHGQLHGWCRRSDRLEPVRLEVYADEKRIETLVANIFRDDLMAARKGNGCHAFVVDLARHGVDPEAVIRVRISDRLLELENSGLKLSALEMVSV
jgi:hypothetical protein